MIFRLFLAWIFVSFAPHVCAAECQLYETMHPSFYSMVLTCNLVNAALVLRVT